jgi:hypothetical protein
MPEQQSTGSGSFVLGLIVCWLLNVVQLGIAFLFFAYGERTLPTALILAGGIGLLQIGYIVPLWYLLRRHGKQRMARGLLTAAGITLLVNAVLGIVIYVNG